MLIAAIWAGALLGATADRTPAQSACASCVPLTDLGGGLYQGHMGGLYPGGANVPPAQHLEAGLWAAAAVVPRDTGGAPHADGLVGVLSVGISSFGQEWRELTWRIDQNALVDGSIVMVQGALNGAFSNRMRDPAFSAWDMIDQKLRAAGVAPQQVQVAFVELTRIDEPAPPFPRDAEDYRDDLREVVRLLHDRFVHLRVAFVFPVAYAGYSAQSDKQEPRSYEQGFGVKWLIEEQLLGDPRLEFDPWRGPVEAPLLLYGPYLWCNGDVPRSDGFSMQRADFELDGLHPSPSGERKLGDLLEGFLVQDPVAHALFAPRSGRVRSSVPIEADTWLAAGQPNTALGTGDGLRVFHPGDRALVRARLPLVIGHVRHAKLALEPVDRCNLVRAVRVADSTWSEATVTDSNAPPFELVGSPPLGMTSAETLAEWVVTDTVRVAASSGVPDTPVSIGLVGDPALAPSHFYAHESGRPAWVALNVDDADGGVAAFCPGLRHSGGQRTHLGWSGAPSLAGGALVFHVTDGPANTVLLPVAGTLSAEVILPGGPLCVSGALVRLPLVVTDAGGDTSFSVAWSAPPHALQPGDSRTLQLVYRDTTVTGGHMSSALVITFQP